MREFLTLGVADAPLTNSTDRMEIFLLLSVIITFVHIPLRQPPSLILPQTPACFAIMTPVILSAPVHLTCHLKSICESEAFLTQLLCTIVYV